MSERTTRRIEMRPVNTAIAQAWSVDDGLGSNRNFLTRSEAVAFARALGRQANEDDLDAEVIFHRRDGAIDHLESYPATPSVSTGRRAHNNARRMGATSARPLGRTF